MIKRAFDIVAALAGLLLVSPLFAIVAALIKIDSPGPVFFRQERVGRRWRPFRIYKFRTMVDDAPRLGDPITFAGRWDPRITRLGRLLRDLKIDELPQLVNVLKGEMSLVGPRPEVPEYVDLFREDYAEILELRPGMTDLASLAFSDEAGILATAEDARTAYVERILPEKIRLAKEYARQWSLAWDLELIWKSSELMLKRLFHVLSRRRRATSALPHPRSAR